MLTWCAVRYIRSAVSRLSGGSVRTLYSKTGEWESNFDGKVRKEIEDYWKNEVLYGHGEEKNVKLTSEKAEKFYVLSMFPYPSGKLHMGHVRVYTISDTMARYHRLQGRKVIHPMGWDAFGLPAENAAIERQELPHTWTNSNIKSMRAQLDQLGCSFDWDREIATCDPSYYHWTQYIFLKMFEAGLVYQKEAEVNWDPVDHTVLANEQIDEQGRSWRSGAVVEKKYLRQWYIKTTAYAKSLWDGLDTVNSELWRDIIAVQKNWIGKCNGCRFDFRLKINGDFLEDPISVHTETPEALFGVSHIELSQNHRFNQQKYYKQGSTDEKVIVLTLEAEHPVTKEMIPVIITLETEEESHLGIPCLFERDNKIASDLGLVYQEVISSDGGEKLTNSSQFSGMSREEAFDAICRYARDEKFGGHLVNQRLHDWLISRQRYWGTPIPMIHCDTCKAVPIPLSDLPVQLPQISQFSGKGLSPLKQAPDWFNTTCPKCGGPATRETDTMDTFVDSTWYFLRYLDPNNTDLPFDPSIAKDNMPIDLYIGGKEHGVLHLYFARFVNHFLCDLGLATHREPFVDLLTQGMVMGQSYSVKGTGQYLRPDQVDFSGPEPVEKETQAPVLVQWEKMSKSKHNGVDPQDVIEEYGVDSTRLCILSNVAPKSDRNWSNDVFKGVLGWQGKIWSMVTQLIELKQAGTDNSVSNEDRENIENTLCQQRNFILREFQICFEKFYLISSAISRLHSLTTVLKKVPPDVMSSSVHFERTLADLIIIISPMAPHFASELWEGLSSVASPTTGHNWDVGVSEQKWPLLDLDYEMNIDVKAGKMTVFTLQLPRGKLDSLSNGEIIDYVKSQNEFKESLETQLEIKSVSCTVDKNVGVKVVFHGDSHTQIRPLVKKPPKKKKKKSSKK